MNITLDQIKDLTSHEADQMRRFSRNLLKRIAKRNLKAKDQYERARDANTRHDTISPTARLQ